MTMKKIIVRSSFLVWLYAGAACATVDKPSVNLGNTPRPATPVEKPAEEQANETPKPLKSQTGTASWYSIKTNYGTKTASGRPLKNNAKTAAHKTWPLGSKVRVTNKRNGRSEIVTITDRGPYIKGRIIDVTVGCAKRLGFHGRGLAPVKIELLERGRWKYKRPR